MALLACKTHEARIAVLENEMAALIRVMEGMNGVTTGILENMKKLDLPVPGPDPTMEAYHR